MLPCGIELYAILREPELTKNIPPMLHRRVNFPFLMIVGLIMHCSSIQVFGQTKAPPSFSQRAQDSIYAYYKLSNLDSLPLNKRITNVSLFLKGALLYQQDSLIYKGLLQKTWLLGMARQYDSAIKYTNILYDLAEKNRDTFYIERALIKLGIYFEYNNQLDQAFQCYNELFKISRITKDTIRSGRSLLSMANIQAILGDYSGSKTTAIDGVKYLEQTTDLRSLSGLYHIISVANREQKNFNEAVKYNVQALNLGKDSISIRAIGIENILIFKNTKALILANQGNYKEAISILKELVSDSMVQQDQREYARVLANLGYVQWMENKENQSSEAILLKARTIRKEAKDIPGFITSNIYLTRYYLEKDKTKALQYAEEAYQNAKKHRSLISILEALGFIFELKENVNEEAKEYDKVHHEIMANNQRNREIYAVTKYENEKLIHKNMTLQDEKNKIARQTLVISILLLLSLGGVVYYYYRQYLYKKRFLQLLDANTGLDIPPVEIPKERVGVAAISTEALEHLLAQLQQFEARQGYLAPHVNAKDLAKSFGSNSSYLSIVVNTYKQKSINQYINDLRIDFAIEKLQCDPIFRKYTIKAISKDIGFNSPEVFAKKFYKKTGIYPSYFIKRLEGEV